jgi:hypothetical protein
MKQREKLAEWEAEHDETRPTLRSVQRELGCKGEKRVGSTRFEFPWGAIVVHQVSLRFVSLYVGDINLYSCSTELRNLGELRTALRLFGGR